MKFIFEAKDIKPGFRVKKAGYGHYFIVQTNLNDARGNIFALCGDSNKWVDRFMLDEELANYLNRNDFVPESA
jgi:hypothetical protein